MSNVEMATKRLENIYRDMAKRFKNPEAISSSPLDDSEVCQAWLPFFGAQPQLEDGASSLGTCVFRYEHPKRYYDLGVYAFENYLKTERYTRVAINWKSFRADDAREVAEFATSLRNAANNAYDMQKAFDGWHKSFTIEEQKEAYRAFHVKYKALMEYFVEKRRQAKEEKQATA